MGYFSNGTEGRDWEMENCEKCVHCLEGYGCPCLIAHMLWNYDECNKPDSILHKMIPRLERGDNGKCFAFQEKSAHEAHPEEIHEHCPTCGELCR